MKVLYKNKSHYQCDMILIFAFDIEHAIPCFKTDMSSRALAYQISELI